MLVTFVIMRVALPGFVMLYARLRLPPTRTDPKISGSGSAVMNGAVSLNVASLRSIGQPPISRTRTRASEVVSLGMVQEYKPMLAGTLEAMSFHGPAGPVS